MRSLKYLYKVNKNLRGIAKQGYCRPSIYEFLLSPIMYTYPLCSLEAVRNNYDENLFTIKNELIISSPESIWNNAGEDLFTVEDELVVL